VRTSAARRCLRTSGTRSGKTGNSARTDWVILDLILGVDINEKIRKL